MSKRDGVTSPFGGVLKILSLSEDIGFCDDELRMGNMFVRVAMLAHQTKSINLHVVQIGCIRATSGLASLPIPHIDAPGCAVHEWYLARAGPCGEAQTMALSGEELHAICEQGAEVCPSCSHCSLASSCYVCVFWEGCRCHMS